MIAENLPGLWRQIAGMAGKTSQVLTDGLAEIDHQRDRSSGVA
jgi:hypothetical protein